MQSVSWLFTRRSNALKKLLYHSRFDIEKSSSISEESHIPGDSKSSVTVVQMEYFMILMCTEEKQGAKERTLHLVLLVR